MRLKNDLGAKLKIFLRLILSLAMCAFLTTGAFASSPPTLSPPAGTALSVGTAGVYYDTSSIHASNGIAPYAYAKSTGSLPPGLSIDPATGAIRGTPEGTGKFDFVVAVTDDSGLSASNAYSINIKAAPTAPGAPAIEIDALVHGFVQSRQNLIASTIVAPGLVERRQMPNAADPVTGRLIPSANGIMTTFSASFVQVEAATNGLDGVVEAESSPFNIWIDGAFMLHNREQNDGDRGSFGMVSTGADYLASEKALIGLSFHYDRMIDPTDEDAELIGNGWLAGPYASFGIGNGVFWDTSLLYGGSSNTIDTAFRDGSFDTRRWLFDTSINGQWRLDEVTTLTPKVRTVYFSETVEDYAIANGNGDVLDIRGFTAEQLRGSLGAEIARQFTLEDGSTLTPKLGLTGGFSSLDGSGAFGRISAGLSLDTQKAWNLDFGLLFNIEGDGQTSAGAKVGIVGRF